MWVTILPLLINQIPNIIEAFGSVFASKHITRKRQIAKLLKEYPGLKERNARLVIELIAGASQDGALADAEVHKYIEGVLPQILDYGKYKKAV